MTISSVYEKDYAHWAETMAHMLQPGAFRKLGIDNPVEEV